MELVVGSGKLDKTQFREAFTTKKLSCPNIFFLALFKTATLFESAGIGNPIMAVFKNAGTGSKIALE